MKATQMLHNLGQSLWLDNLTRGLLTIRRSASGRRDPFVHQVLERPPGVHCVQEQCTPGSLRLRPTSALGKPFRLR